MPPLAVDAVRMELVAALVRPAASVALSYEAVSSLKPAPAAASVALSYEAVSSLAPAPEHHAGGS